MKKLPLALAAVTVALAGTAYAANRNSHVMTVPLPDGAVAHVEYVGNVAPKVTVSPAAVPQGLWTLGAMPDFAGFDRMFAQMDRQMQQIQQMARMPVGANGAPMMNIASYGNMPAGSNSVSVVSVSNGGATCTRRTEIVSQGAGKAPKVTSNVSGDCGAAAGQAVKQAPAALDRT